MLTTDVLREVFADIVGSLKAKVYFTLETNKVLDQNTTDLRYPVACWVLPTEGLVQDAQILQDTISVNILFLDQTATDRLPIERDGAHARMSAIAKIVMRRFHQLYIQSDGEWQGQPLDLVMQGSATFTPIWDDGTVQRTGVAMSATFTSAARVDCDDSYFGSADSVCGVPDLSHEIINNGDGTYNVALTLNASADFTPGAVYLSY